MGTRYPKVIVKAVPASWASTQTTSIKMKVILKARILRKIQSSAPISTASLGSRISISARKAQGDSKMNYRIHQPNKSPRRTATHQSLEEPRPSVDGVPSTEPCYVAKSHECTSDSYWSHELWPGFSRFVVACQISFFHRGSGRVCSRYHRPTATAKKTRNAIIARGPFGLYSALKVSLTVSAVRHSHRAIDTIIGSS